MTWAGLFLKLAALLQDLLAAWRSHRERTAGRLEAVVEQRRKNDDAAALATGARARRRELDTEPGGLRENDGFRRD